MDKPIVIKIENISKTYSISDKSQNSIRDQAFNFFQKSHKRQIKALDNVNLEVRKGEFFGIIGHNGCGKSTLLKIIVGAFPPDKGGKIEVKGKIIRLALGMGFDYNLTARENIYVNGSMLGLTFRQIGKIFHKIISFAELQDFVDTKIRYYSSGMVSRLAFAIAFNAEADIFLMDEFFGGVGDENFRKKSEEVFQRSFIEGRTIIHVSHELNTIQKHCDRILLLHKGKAIIIGKPEDVIPIYQEINKTGKVPILKIPI